MNRQHHYAINLTWTGNTGQGTLNYRGYERSHELYVEGKPVIYASSDPSFRGDRTKYNPEELLVASLSSCHMLWYLHLCSEAGIIVIDYSDKATGVMEEGSDGGGKFKEVTLNPVITITDQSKTQQAEQLHKRANELCFIANSVNFAVKHNAEIKTNTP